MSTRGDQHESRTIRDTATAPPQARKLSSTRACASICCAFTTTWVSAWLITGIVAFIVGSTPAALRADLPSRRLKWVVMLAPLAFVFFFTFRIQTMSASAAQMTFWAFCAVMGLSLASVFLVFTGTSIARTFFIAATMFGATSLYGYATKRDLSRFGSFLIMGLIGVIIASIVNLFLGSSALQFAISVIGILVFVGLTAWDTQNIKEQFSENHDQESEPEARCLRRALALSELREHLPAPAQLHGRAGITTALLGAMEAQERSVRNL